MSPTTSRLNYFVHFLSYFLFLLGYLRSDVIDVKLLFCYQLTTETRERIKDGGRPAVLPKVEQSSKHAHTKLRHAPRERHVGRLHPGSGGEVPKGPQSGPLRVQSVLWGKPILSLAILFPPRPLPFPRFLIYFFKIPNSRGTETECGLIESQLRIAGITFFYRLNFKIFFFHTFFHSNLKTRSRMSFHFWKIINAWMYNMNVRVTIFLFDWSAEKFRCRTFPRSLGNRIMAGFSLSISLAPLCTEFAFPLWYRRSSRVFG